MPGPNNLAGQIHQFRPEVGQYGCFIAKIDCRAQGIPRTWVAFARQSFVKTFPQPAQVHADRPTERDRTKHNRMAEICVCGVCHDVLPAPHTSLEPSALSRMLGRIKPILESQISGRPTGPLLQCSCTMRLRHQSGAGVFVAQVSATAAAVLSTLGPVFVTTHEDRNPFLLSPLLDVAIFGFDAVACS